MPIRYWLIGTVLESLPSINEREVAKPRYAAPNMNNTDESNFAMYLLE
jgi:hypothetical protein